MDRTTRREFLWVAGAAVGALVLPLRGLGGGIGGGVIKFGVVADVHQDIMPDGVARLSAFVEAMKREEGLDFVMQLGDFCVPKPANRGFVDVWKGYPGERFDVLGNHDVDGGFSWAQTMAFWGMKDRYYSFERKGVTFVVLDGNEKGGVRGGYPIFVGEEQLGWFRKTVGAARGPVVVVSHQPFEHDGGIENGAALREIVADSRVVACLNGHDHADYVAWHDEVAYWSVNSASYRWLGEAGEADSFSAEVHARYPALKYVAAYRESVWGVVTLDFGRGVMEVRGRGSEWVGADPWARGVEGDRARVRPGVSGWRGRVG